MVSKFVLSLMFIFSILMLGVLIPSASFAASPFLVEHLSVESMNQSGQGRASFYTESDALKANEKANAKAPRKSVTLAESLVHLRQCHQSGGHQSSHSSHALTSKTTIQSAQ